MLGQRLPPVMEPAGRRSLTLLGIVCALPIAAAFGAAAAGPEKLNIEGLVDPVIVQVPENYDPAEKWPVLFYWHGPTGGPTTRVVFPACERKDWIIVGMAYTSRGLLGIEEERIADEIGGYRRARPIIERRFSVDPDKVFAGGYFTGGWVAAELLSRDPSLAGILLIGSGFLDRQALPVRSVVQGKPVYVGVGSVYANHLMALRAAERFRAEGARVTWEAWDFLGRAAPKDFGEHPGMRQWMRLHSGLGDPDAMRAQAKQWGQSRLGEIEKMPVAGERFLALQRFRELPFLQLFGKSAVASVDRKIRELAAQPEGIEEGVAWVKYQGLLRAELRDRRSEVLRGYLRAYRELLEKHPDTQTAKMAKAEANRLSALVR